MEKRGLILIELLALVSILAIIAYAINLAFQPAEIFKQSRDSQRLADLNILNKVIQRYLSENQIKTIPNQDDFLCSVHFGASSASAKTSPFQVKRISHQGVLESDGSGWIAINLKAGKFKIYDDFLPKDPLNDQTHFYAYSCAQNSTNFELNTKLESKLFRRGGKEDKESTDGGDNKDWYEVGNTAQLTL